MIFRKIFAQGKKEQDVTADIRRQISLLCSTCDRFRMALEKQDKELFWDVIDLEREGDSIRREVISHIYEGAFLPYLRPDLCKFVEIVDEVLGLVKDAASLGLNMELPERLKGDCTRVALLNFRMSEMLLLTYETILKGQDPREKMLAIRIYEKKIDDLKDAIFSEAYRIPIRDFWAGKRLSDMIKGLTMISDMIEDASDHLQIIHVSMR
ncbi:MAG: TIGR00153 family protein [Desulfobacteraceae bacterium]|nr:MAG: TIGR00153 family protein [Desulfobacteraceae bacterium]